MPIDFKTVKPGLDLSHQIMKGDDGGYYVPHVTEDGRLVWIKSEVDMPDVEEANILGPAGAPGPSGVYVGTEEPTDPNILIWLVPTGEVSDYVMTEAEVKSYIDESLEEVENGTY